MLADDRSLRVVQGTIQEGVALAAKAHQGIKIIKEPPEIMKKAGAQLSNAPRQDVEDSSATANDEEEQQFATPGESEDSDP